MPSQGWHSPSRCVWSDHTFKREVYPIAHHYPDLQHFFVEHLGVPYPTVHSQVEELQDLCNSQKGMPEKISDIKTLIKEINVYKPQCQNLRELLNKPVIPVIDTNGREQLVRPKDTFAIVDRQKYGKLFQGKVSVLAVPLEELRHFRYFLSALGLETRYMSNLAHKTTDAKNAFSDGTISKDFRDRALALVRYVHRQR